KIKLSHERGATEKVPMAGSCKGGYSMGNQGKIQEEKELKAMSGYLMLFVGILGLVLGGAALLYGIMRLSATGGGTGGWMILAGLVLLLIFFILLCGLKVIDPNEALVLALFGNY